MPISTCLAAIQPTLSSIVCHGFYIDDHLDVDAEKVNDGIQSLLELTIWLYF